MIKNFRYFKPSEVKDACSLLKAYAENIKVLAGGTDLIVAMQEGRLAPDYIVDIKGLEGIEKIEYDHQAELLKIGAATQLNAIAVSGLVKEHWQILADAARSVGSYQIRNRATIGGNLCNSSPAADTLAPLMVLEAQVKIVGLEGSRVMQLEDFLVGPAQNELRAGEIVTEIRLPKPPGKQVGRYIKHSRRKAVDLAIVGVAVVAHKIEAAYQFKIALGAVAPTPVRVREAEKILSGSQIDKNKIDEAVQAALKLLSPITDLRGSKEYRLKIAEVQTRRAIEELIASLG